MNIKQIEKKLINSGIEPNEARVEAKIMVKHYCGFSDVDLVLKDEFDDCEELQNAVDIRIEKKLPIQYILGSAYFMGEYFRVNENVLIPRDETEILVRKAIEIINANKFEQVLDIGTGSGCIACMIAKRTHAQVLGVDISTGALQVALENTSKFELFNRAIFRKSDLFSNVKNTEQFDMVISNPPYIPLTEKKNLQIEVGFEPESALFADDEYGISFYEKIIEKSTDFLKPNGYLMFELGIGQSALVRALMDEKGFKDIEIEKDLANIDRIIYGRY